MSLALTGLAWPIKWTVASRTGHVDERLDPAYVHMLDRKYATSAGLLVTAAALSFVSWTAVLFLALAVTVYFFRPPETPVYRTDEAPAVEGEEAAVPASG